MNEVDQYNVNSFANKIVRLVAIIIPFVMLIYGLLMQFDLINNESYVSNLTFYLIIIPWLIVSIYQYLVPSIEKTQLFVRLLFYHLFSISYILFVSGLSSPITTSYILLLVVSYVYFNKTGLKYSLIALLFATTLDIIFHFDNLELIIVDVISLATILLVALSLIGICNIQASDRKAVKQLKDEASINLESLLTLINNMTETVISTDKDGRIKLYNAACLGLLDTNTDLNDCFIDSIAPFHDKDKNTISIFKYMQDARGMTIKDDIFVTLKEETRRLEIIYSPVRSTFRNDHVKHRSGYVMILRDVTKVKNLEEEKDEFISVVSHELRTPITVAEGTLSNMQLILGRPDIPNEIITEALDVAHEQIIFLAKMVNDLSALSRAERGVSDEVEDIEVREMMNNLFKEYAPQAEARGLKLNLDISSSLGIVRSSRLYLEELLQNFITNAIKYTLEGDVTLIAKKLDGSIFFAVKDTGIGISKSEQVNIFKKFYSVHDYRTREANGTGLGLYVAVKLANKINTTINVDSRLNHGSTFSITLPSKTKKRKTNVKA